MFPHMPRSPTDFMSPRLFLSSNTRNVTTLEMDRSHRSKTILGKDEIVKCSNNKFHEQIITQL